MTAGSRRTWGGRTAEERDAVRRAAFLEAGLELYGTRPSEDVSVAEIVATAGQTRRAFYELFADREDLLRQVDANVGRGALGVAVAVATANGPLPQRPSWPVAEAVLRAVLAYYREDPRRINVAFVAVVGVSAEMEAHRRHQLRTLSEGMAALLGDRAGDDPLTRRRAAQAFAGALSELLIDWAHGPEDDIDGVERELVTLLRARFFPDAA